jgi:hypothetical protein
MQPELILLISSSSWAFIGVILRRKKAGQDSLKWPQTLHLCAFVGPHGGQFALSFNWSAEGLSVRYRTDKKTDWLMLTCAVKAL